LIVTILATVGLPGLLALMAVESFGLPPIPSEVILPFTGFLIADGTFPLSGAVIAALLGGLVGSYAGYAVGRWWRHRITGLGIGHLRLEQRHLDRVDQYFARHGESTVGLARLVPVIRSYISYPAGTAKMEPVRFGVYTLLGSVPFTLALIYAGIVLRSNWKLVSAYLVYLDYPLIALVVLVVVFLVLQVAGVLAPGWPPRRSPREH
jgi:membrane protein DedA with SNARE-associated domain